MKIKHLFVFLGLLVLISCSSPVEESKPWIVKDVSQREERIALLMDKKPISFNLSLKGNTDGAYKIYLVGSQIQPNITFDFKGGAIDTLLGRAWVQPACKIIYVPERVTSGQLAIDLKLISN